MRSAAALQRRPPRLSLLVVSPLVPSELRWLCRPCNILCTCAQARDLVHIFAGGRGWVCTKRLGASSRASSWASSWAQAGPAELFEFPRSDFDPARSDKQAGIRLPRVGNVTMCAFGAAGTGENEGLTPILRFQGSWDSLLRPLNDFTGLRSPDSQRGEPHPVVGSEAGVSKLGSACATAGACCVVAEQTPIEGKRNDYSETGCNS